MDKQDWYEMGEQVGDLVQSAIDSDNFDQLNKAITDTVDEALKIFVRPGTAYGDAEEQARMRKIARDRAAGIKTSVIRTAGQAKAWFFQIAGIAAAGIFGLGAIAGLALSGAWGGFAVPGVASLAIAGAGAALAWHGWNLRKRAARQNLYLRILGDRESCSIQELADGTNASREYVAKDLKAMIAAGMFPDGAWMDRVDTTFIATRNAYEQYRAAQDSYDQRHAEEERVRQAMERTSAMQEANLTEEQKQIVREGRDFISHLQECNERISNRDMTEKLLRLEAVVTKIFDQVAAKPSSAPDLHKLMNYYLPTTRKLIDAYIDLDSQPVKGRNIEKTKKEIVASLDTINTAFENLLDSFFQDTSWDISSDISVMRTMLKQDGLMGSDFERVRQVADDVAGTDLDYGSAAAQTQTSQTQTSQSQTAPVQTQQAQPAAQTVPVQRQQAQPAAQTVPAQTQQAAQTVPAQAGTAAAAQAAAGEEKKEEGVLMASH